jgi:hypothetical protein
MLCGSLKLRMIDPGLATKPRRDKTLGQPFSLMINSDDRCMIALDTNKNSTLVHRVVSILCISYFVSARSYLFLKSER